MPVPHKRAPYPQEYYQLFISVETFGSVVLAFDSDAEGRNFRRQMYSFRAHLQQYEPHLSAAKAAKFTRMIFSPITENRSKALLIFVHRCRERFGAVPLEDWLRAL